MVRRRRKLPIRFFLELIRSLTYGETKLAFDGKITLPSIRYHHGQIRIENKPEFDVQAKFFDDPNWISIRDIQASTRVFIYSETQLSEAEIIRLKDEGKQFGHDVHFRSKRHAAERVKLEQPLAFISHDSRDKQEVARKIALNLQRLMCPVWYDEFSLSVGDHLREKIEKGLKECKKCVLVLSPNFFSNNGWTKKEFDSIFTREILEEAKLILPVWYNVTRKNVFEYSPSLLNVKGLDWKTLGEEETSRLLCRAIVDT